MTGPFPWSRLPKVDPAAERVMEAVAAWLELGASWPREMSARHATSPAAPRGYVIHRQVGAGGRGTQLVVARDRSGTWHPGTRTAELGVTRTRVVGAAILEGDALYARLIDPSAGVVQIRFGGVAGFVVVPGMLARAVAWHLLSGPDELAAPRPLTATERAVLVVAVASVIRDLGWKMEVVGDGGGLGGPQVPGMLQEQAAVVDVEVQGPVSSTVAVVVPASVAVAARPRAPVARLARDARWLDTATVRVPLVRAATTVALSDLGSLRPRAVLVAQAVGGRDEAELRTGRGALRVGVAPASGRVTVLSAYARRTMDEMLADDVAVEVAVAIGDLPMSVRSLLELSPGQVLELGRPVGSSVELRVGARVIAVGELVDVAGGVGVRVLSVDRASIPAP